MNLVLSYVARLLGLGAMLMAFFYPESNAWQSAVIFWLIAIMARVDHMHEEQRQEDE